MAIYVRNTLPVSQISHLESDIFEVIWVTIKLHKTTLLLCSVYLPPNTTSNKQSQFLEYLSDSVLEAKKLVPDLTVFVGDFNAGNCWLSNDSPKHSPVTSFEMKLKSTSETLSLTKVINTATHVHSNTHNLRDLAFVDRADLVKFSGVVPAFSNIDHIPVSITISLLTIEESRHSTFTIWDYPKADVDGFINTLRGVNWNAIAHADIDDAVEQSTCTILRTTETHIPRKIIKTRS